MDLFAKPHLIFTETRKLKRQFNIYSGPTNSGKTYEAIEKLKKAKNGIYLGPLRLMAYEQYINLTNQGIICNLITGEERIINKGATIQCSTVEMYNKDKEYDCIVLDEAQMMYDNNRGGKWTEVILSGRCLDINICCAPFALKSIQKLIEICNDNINIIEKQRLVPLCIQDKPVLNIDKLKKGDALITFSRNNIYLWANFLKEKGFKCSILYGNLPYDVRENEADKFRKGITDLLIATDCIGMGLNLPIQRVIFLTDEKFNGEEIVKIPTSDLQQISGRAGRYKIYNTGYVAGYTKDALNIVKLKLNSKIESQIPRLSIPKEIINLKGTILDNSIDWLNTPSEGYVKSLPEDYLYRVEISTDIFGEKDKENIFNFSIMPFNFKNEILCALWDDLMVCVKKNKIYNYKYNNKIQDSTLLDLETEYQKLDLYYRYCNIYDKSKIDEINKEKLKISHIIMNILNSRHYKQLI